MTSRTCNRFGGVILPVSLALLLSGCGMSVGSSGGSGDDADRQRDDVGVDIVLVEFVNETTLAVETEFFATNEALDDPETELFIPLYHVTTEIGLAGLGTLGPEGDDAREYPCTANLVLGTTGGSFKDNNVGTLEGTGVQRILEEGNVFSSGATVTFTYSEDGDDFTVTVGIR